jgi:hypothetical protein
VLGAGYLVKMPPAGSDLDLEIEILDDPGTGSTGKMRSNNSCSEPVNPIALLRLGRAGR